MKKLLTAIAALGLIGTPAFAADMAVKAPPSRPPAPVPVYRWTGCYIGGQVGGGWGRKDFSTDRTFFFAQSTGATIRDDTSGFLGGGQVGCDWQFAPMTSTAFAAKRTDPVAWAPRRQG
jgi:outer membrane immunogenic protein